MDEKPFLLEKSNKDAASTSRSKDAIGQADKQAHTLYRDQKHDSVIVVTTKQPFTIYNVGDQRRLSFAQAITLPL